MFIYFWYGQLAYMACRIEAGQSLYLFISGMASLTVWYVGLRLASLYIYLFLVWPA
jgi:hypothetical protein